jgi:hypothetical protein
MSDRYSTEQEAFWAGSFGSDYVDRNQGRALLSTKLNTMTQALKAAGPIGSVVEFGANIGYNLRACVVAAGGGAGRH